MGAHLSASEQPCCQWKELRAELRAELSLCQLSHLTWCYYSKVWASQFFRRTIQCREWNARRGRQALRHSPGQELFDVILMRNVKHWKLNKRARISSCNQISLPALKCHSSHPQLCLYSILWCFWVPKWMVLFHRWISWSEISCPVSLTWRGKNPAWERHWGLKNLIHHINLFGILAFSWDLQSISSWT